MRQICMELWIEHHGIGWLLGKAALLLFMLSGGIPGVYPCPIMGLLMLCSLEVSALKMNGQIDYILPLTEKEKKRKVLLKGVFVAGLYSMANTAGYIRIICRDEKYRWDLELILFLLYMTVVFILYFFYLRLQLWLPGRGDAVRESGGKKTKAVRFEGKEGWNALGCLLTVFSCLIYTTCRFQKVSFLDGLLRNMQMAEAVLGILTLTLMLHAVWYSIKRLDCSEYSP